MAHPRGQGPANPMQMPPATGDQPPAIYTRTMLREPKSAGDARRLVGDALGEWGLLQLKEPSALVVSELVGNAAKHGRSSIIRVTITQVDSYRVRIAVVDRSHREPAAREAGPDDEGGRGLLLVAAMSARWGIDRLPWGKKVWAEIEGAPQQVAGREPCETEAPAQPPPE